MFVEQIQPALCGDKLKRHLFMVPMAIIGGSGWQYIERAPRVVNIINLEPKGDTFFSYQMIWSKMDTGWPE